LEDWGPPRIGKTLVFRTVVEGGNLQLVEKLKRFLVWYFAADSPRDDAPWDVTLKIFCPESDLLLSSTLLWFSSTGTEMGTHTEAVTNLSRVYNSVTIPFVTITAPARGNDLAKVNLSMPVENDFANMETTWLTKSLARPWITISG